MIWLCSCRNSVNRLSYAIGWPDLHFTLAASSCFQVTLNNMSNIPDMGFWTASSTPLVLLSISRASWFFIVLTSCPALFCLLERGEACLIPLECQGFWAAVNPARCWGKCSTSISGPLCCSWLEYYNEKRGNLSSYYRGSTLSK